jgi:hypothetical protein
MDNTNKRTAKKSRLLWAAIILSVTCCVYLFGNKHVMALWRPITRNTDAENATAQVQERRKKEKRRALTKIEFEKLCVKATPQELSDAIANGALRKLKREHLLDTAFIVACARNPDPEVLRILLENRIGNSHIGATFGRGFLNINADLKKVIEAKNPNSKAILAFLNRYRDPWIGLNPLEALRKRKELRDSW